MPLFYLDNNISEYKKSLLSYYEEGNYNEYKDFFLSTYQKSLENTVEYLRERKNGKEVNNIKYKEIDR